MFDPTGVSLGSAAAIAAPALPVILWSAKEIQQQHAATTSIERLGRRGDHDLHV